MWRLVISAIIALTLSGCLPEARDRQFDRCRLEHKDDMILCMKVNGYKNTCTYGYASLNSCFIPQDDWLWRLEEDVTKVSDNPKMIGDFIESLISGIETTAMIIIIIPGELISFLFPIWFLPLLFKRLFGRYTISLSGHEKRRCNLLTIYLITLGVGEAVVYRNDADRFMVFLGGWECFIGIVIWTLGPTWLGTYKRVDKVNS